MTTIHPSVPQYVENLDDEQEPPPTPIGFRIRGRDFFAAGRCPAAAMFDMATLAADDDESNRAQAAKVLALPRFLDMVIMPEDAERFAEATKDPIDPIDMKDVGKVVRFLMRKYGGGAPLDGSSPSSGGQSGTGQSSMGGAPLVVSTQGASPSNGS